MFNYKYHIFCCVNERSPENPKSSCKAKGSEAMLDFLKRTIHEKGLKREVRVTSTRCLGACAKGPTVVIYPEGIWYTVPKVEDAQEIIERHILNGEKVERLIMKKNKAL